ncbi:MAG: carbamoyltransferase [Saprospiraceae bacterium]|jgi:carbamoyltransferase|nr:carbamoyltransferase [Saprospiraceae bacterium]
MNSKNDTRAEYTLGLNAWHGDSAAAIFRGAELIAATEEERIRRVKHWAGLPVEAVRFCLREAGISLRDVAVLTVSRDPYAKLGQKILYALRQGVFSKNLRARAGNAFSIKTLKTDLALAFGVDPADWPVRVQFVEHHRSHLASAFFVSPFEEAALLSVDGMGDFTSTMRAIGRDNRIEVLDSVSYPHSLGIFYTAFTQLLGFPHYGDEYKVMGLAPYGKPVFLEKLRAVVRLKSDGLFELDPRCFRHFSEGASMSWQGGAPEVGPLFSNYLAREFGPVRQPGEPLTDRHRDLAASVQAMCEETIFHLATDLYRKTGLKNLCIAGGVAQNSVANGKLRSHTPFERVFVPPAGHDAGTSIGSALYALHQIERLPRPEFRHHAYTGYRAGHAEIEALLTNHELPIEKMPNDALFDAVTDCLIRGGVVGWFQGRAEFGPRALGNRSILADPRRSDAQALLNEKIKRRESFRPFAPSVLHEQAADYFENPDSVPFMEKVYPVRPEKRAVIPAVTHVDGTGRLQTVERRDNPRYHRLIEVFFEKTGVPVLLNTSFNENEPIVNTPEHALACFLRTNMDLLVLENYLVRRPTDTGQQP